MMEKIWQSNFGGFGHRWSCVSCRGTTPPPSPPIAHDGHSDRPWPLQFGSPSIQPQSRLFVNYDWPNQTQAQIIQISLNIWMHMAFSTGNFHALFSQRNFSQICFIYNYMDWTFIQGRIHSNAESSPFISWGWIQCRLRSAGLEHLQKMPNYFYF